MSNFTFLTREQCFGTDILDVLKIRGTKAAITDFSILLGGWVSTEHVENENEGLYERRTGCYWTKSYDENCNPHVVYVDGNKHSYDVNKRIYWGSTSLTVLINL